ncbi:MAG: DMT family transporter [Hyphomicrobiaceae bacterium]
MRSEAAASVWLVLGGALWGLFWLPVRGLGELGLPGAWPGAAIYASTAIVLLPLAWHKRGSICNSWRELSICGLLTGTAFSLYSTSFLLTDVVRVILLFYLTPIWGTLLGVVVLGEQFTLSRALALMFALAGMLLVLGLGEVWPWPHNLGDWLALISGLFWAFGSMKLYQMGQVGVCEQILAFAFGSLLVTATILTLGGAAIVGEVEFSRLMIALPWGLLAAFYVVPMVFLTIWPATLLTPGRVGLLLMSEVVIGVSSAAMLTAEPFGWRELLGSLMILGAALIEVLGRRPND